MQVRLIVGVGICRAGWSRGLSLAGAFVVCSSVRTAEYSVCTTQDSVRATQYSVRCTPRCGAPGGSYDPHIGLPNSCRWGIGVFVMMCGLLGCAIFFPAMPATHNCQFPCDSMNGPRAERHSRMTPLVWPQSLRRRLPRTQATC